MQMRYFILLVLGEVYVFALEESPSTLILDQEKKSRHKKSEREVEKCTDK